MQGREAVAAEGVFRRAFLIYVSLFLSLSSCVVVVR